MGYLVAISLPPYTGAPTMLLLLPPISFLGSSGGNHLPRVSANTTKLKLGLSQIPDSEPRTHPLPPTECWHVKDGLEVLSSGMYWCGREALQPKPVPSCMESAKAVTATEPGP